MKKVCWGKNIHLATTFKLSKCDYGLLIFMQCFWIDLLHYVDCYREVSVSASTVLTFVIILALVMKMG